MKAVIYARYSSDNQREESIEGQLRECKEYADRNDIVIVKNYIDRALSAKTDNRPEFQRIIKDSAKELFDVVLVWKLDRFAVTDTILHTTNPFSVKTELRLFQQKKVYQKDRRELFLNQCLKVWQSII